MISSTADITITNSSNETISSPLHVVIDVLDTTYDNVQMPDALGSSGTGPYGKYYHNLSGSLSEGELSAGESVTFQVRFVRYYTVRFRYDMYCFGVLAVVPANRAPTADPGGPYSGNAGEGITFDGSGSGDPDGDPINCTWDFGDGSTETGFAPVHSYSEAGTFTVALTVEDGRGGTDTATTTVTVHDVTPPSVTISSPVDGSLFNTGPITVSGTVDDDTATVLVNGIESAVADGSFTAVEVVLQEGANVISATATDPAGNTATASISVTLDTTPASVAITSPVDGSFLNISPVTVSGTVDDVTATVLVNGIEATVTDGSFTAVEVVLQEGANVISATATDPAGNSATANISVTHDTTPASVTISSPTDGRLFNTSPITVSGTIDDVLSTVEVNGTQAAVNTDGTFSAAGIALQEGDNTITALSTDPAGNTETASIEVSLDTEPPNLEIVSPTAGSTVTDNPPPIQISFGDTLSGINPESLTFAANGSSIEMDCQLAAASGTCTPTTPLAQGPVELIASISDPAGNTASSKVDFTIDIPPLTVTITSPVEGEVFGSSPITVRGTVSDPDARVFVQGGKATVSETAFEARDVTITEGTNRLTARARNDAGDEATASSTVILDTIPPILSVLSPTERSIFVEATAPIYGWVSDNTPVTGTINGQPFSVEDNSFNGTAALDSGRNTINISCQDGAGNEASRQLTLYLDAEPITVTQVEPADGAFDVAPTSPVTVTFSEPVNPESLTPSTFFVRSGPAILQGDLTVSSDGLTATLAPFQDLPPGSDVEVMITTGVTDAQGNPLASTYASRFTTSGDMVEPGVFIGEVYDDTRSLPLDEALVAALAADSGDVLEQTQTDERGRYLLTPGRSDVLIQVTKPGFAVVERKAVSQQGSFAEVLDARLTPLGAPQPVQAVFGAEIQDALGNTLKIPPGAFDADGEVTLTQISEQGPRLPFPPGWTPLSLVDIQAPEPFDPPAALIMVDRSTVSAGKDGVIARYDEVSRSWLALANVTLSADGTAELEEITDSGQYALLVADLGDGAPAAPVPGEPLTAGSAIPIPENAEGTGTVTPPVGRIDDPTPAGAKVTISAATPLRSGTPLLGDFVELFVLRDGGRVAPLATSQDLFGYRVPTDEEGISLNASFPVAPSQVFSPLEASEGTITVSIGRSSPVVRHLVGTAGGGVQTEDGSRAIIPAGALAADVPVHLSRLSETDFAVVTPEGLKFLGGLKLDLSGVTATSGISLSLGGRASFVPTGGSVVVAQLQSVRGQTRLVPVALALVEGDDLTTVTEFNGTSVPGVRAGGSYGFYLFEGPLELVQGTAQDEDGRRDGMVVEIEKMPFVSLTDATGSYTLLSPPGPFTLIATAATSLDQARIVGDTGTPLPDLVISATPPQVERITVRLPRIEGNFAGPVVLLGKPAPVIDDDSGGQSSGNGNGEIDPGERIELSLTVRNEGTIPAEGGSLVLWVRGPDGPVTVAPETMDMDTLEPQEAVFVGPFVFTVPSGLDPALLRYTFTYLSQQGQRSSQTSFRLPMDVDHPDVPVISEVAVHFSEPVLTSSLEAGFYLELEDGAEVKPVSAKLLIDAAGSTATLRPLATLEDNSVYRITLTQTIVDGDGRSLTDAPVVERFRTEDRTSPAAVDPGLIEALVPDDEGFVTISGSLGTVNPDDTVTVLNQKTGLTVLATVEADGSFVARIEAQVTDRLSLIVSDASGNSTTIESVPFARRDPVSGEIVSVVIGRDGGTVTSTEGINLEVPMGAVFRATEFSVSRLEEPFQLPVDITADPDLVAAFEVLFGVADRVQIQAKADRFAGAVHLSLPPPPNAIEGDLFVLVRSLTVTMGGPLADLDHNTGLTAAENPLRTLERLEIVDTATVKDVEGELVLSTDSPPFSGITGPGDFTWLRVKGPLTFLAGEARRDSATGVPIAGAAVQSLPGADETSPFATMTNLQGRFVVADAGAGGTHQVGAVVASRLDVFDPGYNRVIRRDVRGVVGSPEPPHSVVAHLEEPFVLPATLPGAIIDKLGDLEPPDLQVFVTGSSLTRGYGLVGDRLTVTVSATDNDEIAFVGLQVDQGSGSQPVSLGSNGTFEFTPSAEGLIRFRAQAHDRTGNTTFVDRNVRILQVDSQGQAAPPQSLPGQTPGLIQPPDEPPEDGPGDEPTPAPLIPGAHEISFDGDIVVLVSEPLDPGTVNESTVEVLDPEGQTVLAEVTTEFGDSVVRITPKRYLRLGALYTVRLSSAILDRDGENFPGATLGFECPGPEEVATIDLPNATDVALVDELELGDDVLEDVLVATNYPIPVVDYGAIHLYQVRDKDDPDLLLTEPRLLHSIKTYGLPESLAVDGSKVFVGNRWYGHLVMPEWYITDYALSYGWTGGSFTGAQENWTPIIEWGWGAGMPTPPSNLEVFDLSYPEVFQVTDPLLELYRPMRDLAWLNSPREFSFYTFQHIWNPNTVPARVEITDQGVAVLNFLDNIEMFTPTSPVESLGVIEHTWSPLHDPGRCIAGPEAGMVCPYDRFPPFFRCLDDGSPRAWECVRSYEFYDTVFFDDFAVSIVGRSELTPNGGLRIYPLVDPEEPMPRNSELSFYPMPKEVRVHVGGRVGAVPAFEWEDDEGTLHEADLAFVNTPQETPVPRLRIFDVTNPRSPVLMSVLDNVYGNMSFDACSGLAYLYGGKIINEITDVVENEGVFHVIDFNDPYDPIDLNDPGEGREPFQVKGLGGGTIGYNAITNDDHVVYMGEEAGIGVVNVRMCTEAEPESGALTKLPLLPTSDGIVAFANGAAGNPRKRTRKRCLAIPKKFWKRAGTRRVCNPVDLDIVGFKDIGKRDSEEEWTVGGLVLLNDDDDDRETPDGTTGKGDADNIQASLDLSRENDLIKITLSVKNPEILEKMDAKARVKLEAKRKAGGGDIKFYDLNGKAAKGSDLSVTNLEWWLTGFYPIGFPKELLVSGEGTSADPRDIELILSLKVKGKTFKDTVKLTVADIILEPITNEPIDPNTGATIFPPYNPAGVELYGEARFSITVYPFTIPDNNIMWEEIGTASDKKLDITFNTGRTIWAKGIREGTAKLQANIMGFSDQLSNASQFAGIQGRMPQLEVEVFPHKIHIPLKIYIICENLAICPDIPIAEIMTRVNEIYEQVGIEWEFEAPELIPNQVPKCAYCDPSCPMGYRNCSEVVDLRSDTGGAELYFIEFIHGAVGIDYLGGSIVFEQDDPTETATVVAHELGHALNLDEFEQVPTDMFINSTWVRDWNNGPGQQYYSTSIGPEDLIQRLLMCDIAYCGDWRASVDIPGNYLFGTAVGLPEVRLCPMDTSLHLADPKCPRNIHD
jgi:hypothetical protein